MSYTEVTRDSWGSRIGKSFGGVIFGILMFLGSFPLLFWNEGRAVQTAKSLEEGAASVVTVSADRVDPGYDQKLVHLTGTSATEETLTDPDFGVSVNAIRLVREVEMYQWREETRSETRKKLGGSTETVTTYDYAKTWSSDLIDSSAFKEPGGHQNPASMRLSSATYAASKVTLGAFRLASAQIAKLGSAAPLSITHKHLETVPSGLGAKAEAGQFYLGADPGTPQIGDLRVKFTVVRPGPVSLVAMQVGDTFQPYQTRAGNTLLLVDEGTRSAAEMFKEAQAGNTALTWILRVVGFFLMFAGARMVSRPLSVMGDVIPLLGTLLGAGLGFFAFFISFGLSIVTISIAWIVYRPLLAIALLLLAVGAVVLVVMRGVKRKAAGQALPIS